MKLVDRLGRPLASLRVSVTDRCNLRCTYCMPEKEYVWLPRADLLSFEEIVRVARVFAGLGVAKIRLTGGEPLQRTELPALVRMLAAVSGIQELALTTNGVQLADRAAELHAAGLTRLTVSLDTLKPDRFRALTGRDAHAHVLAGLDAARRAGFVGIKIDTVVLRGDNEDEVADLVAFGREIGAEVRFIEYMDVGGATRWASDKVAPRGAILAAVAARFGEARPLPGRGSAPAERFQLADGTTFGIIASTTEPFCGSCDRGRLTADGMWLQCLYARAGLDLRGPLREGKSAEELGALVATAWRGRADRGAEQRLGAADRGPIIPVSALKRDPHLEMHTRGG
jgi:cyclic pyranopterin phosphate synthase